MECDARKPFPLDASQLEMMNGTDIQDVWRSMSKPGSLCILARGLDMADASALLYVDQYGLDANGVQQVRLKQLIPTDAIDMVRLTSDEAAALPIDWQAIIATAGPDMPTVDMDPPAEDDSWTRLVIVALILIVGLLIALWSVLASMVAIFVMLIGYALCRSAANADRAVEYLTPTPATKTRDEEEQEPERWDSQE